MMETKKLLFTDLLGGKTIYLSQIKNIQIPDCKCGSNMVRPMRSNDKEKFFLVCANCYPTITEEITKD